MTHKGANPKISYSIFNGPFGPIGLASVDKELIQVQHRITGEAKLKEILEQKYSLPAQKDFRSFRELAEQFKDYFNGLRKTFDWPIRFQQGTPFQIRVWKSLIKIPYGTTRSYSWLANSVGKPKAYRAAGNANSKNPLSIIIPCHRVIRENGDLGGYTGGTDIKKFLLNLEQK